MKSHFFDIDCLLKVNQKAWIVDKLKPNKPIMKISPEDFNLFESGIYQKMGHKIDFNGKTFYLDTDTYNRLRVKIKKSGVNLGNLGISLQEFLNPDIIDELEYKINYQILEPLKNSPDDIYIILSKQTRNSYKKMLEKIKEAFREFGVNIKRYYFISETFYSQNRDDVKYAKLKLLAEHLTGHKIEEDKFVDKEVEEYRVVNYWDNSIETQKYGSYINDVIRHCLKGSTLSIQEVIKENLIQLPCKFITHQVFDNGVNPVLTRENDIILQRFIKTFESFK